MQITPNVAELTALVSYTATVLASTTSAQLEQVYEAIISTAFDDGFSPYSINESDVTLDVFSPTTFEGQWCNVTVDEYVPALS